MRAATGGEAPGAPPEFLAASGAAAAGAVTALMAERWARPHATWHHVAPDRATGVATEILRQAGARRVAVAADPLLDALGVARACEAAGIAVVELPRSQEAVHRVLASADAGATVPAYAVAETGTLVEVAGPGQPRALSLLPPRHLAFLRAESLLATLDDLFIALGGAPPAHALSFISGPSGTADIGLQPVTGVHGPGDVHLIVVDSTVPEAPPAPPGGASEADARVKE